MRHTGKIFALTVSLFVTFFSVFTVAQATSFDGVADIYLSGVGLTYKIGGSVASLTVASNSFTVITGETDVATIHHYDGLSMENNGNLIVQCITNESKVTVSANTTVTFTPIGTRVCIPSNQSSPGGGGGFVAIGTLAPAESKKEEATFIDISKLIAFDQTTILSIVKRMIDAKTFEMPKNKKFVPKGITNADFAARILLMLGNQRCGDKGCFQTAKTKSYLVKTLKKEKSQISRVQYLYGLFKARGIALLAGKKADLSKVCKDIKKPTDLMAQVFLTAKKYKLVSVLKGGKCQLEKGFSRLQAVQLASKILTVK